MNSTVWSSLHSPPFPLVERQTYIIPTSVAALRETITEKGISNKDVLSEFCLNFLMFLSLKLNNFLYSRFEHRKRFGNAVGSFRPSPSLNDLP